MQFVLVLAGSVGVSLFRNQFDSSEFEASAQTAQLDLVGIQAIEDISFHQVQARFFII